MTDGNKTPQKQSASIRYDYADEGAYFVTICTHDRLHLFGTVIDDAMCHNTYGDIACEEWERTAVLRPNVTIDSFVVMPNHVHAIVMIHTRRGGMHPAQKPNNLAVGALGAIVRGYKGAVTRRINHLSDSPTHPIWQRGYHDHIIRDERGLNTIRAYVATNPARWESDSLFTFRDP